MAKVIILTDYTCDLNDLLVQRNVKAIPLKVCFGSEIYKDQEEISAEEMFKKVEEKNALPTTAAATIDEYTKVFKELLDGGNEVVYTGIGSKLSSSFQNAMIAKNELSEDEASRLFLVDSGNLSTGIGLLVLKMCDLRDKGKTGAEIYEEINKIVPCVRAQFAVKTLDYLHKGGRCSGTTKIFGTLLRIRPILRVFNGQIILSEKIFGIRFEKALRFQMEDVIKNLDHIDPEYLFITHAQTDADADYIYDNLPSEVKSKFKHIYITKAGCVISAHCGVGTIGILYIKDSPLLDDK